MKGYFIIVITLLSFADDCRVGKKRKSEENDQMLAAEQSRKLAKTEVTDKVKCVKAFVCILTAFLQSLRETNLIDSGE